MKRDCFLFTPQRNSNRRKILIRVCTSLNSRLLRESSSGCEAGRGRAKGFETDAAKSGNAASGERTHGSVRDEEGRGGRGHCCGTRAAGWGPVGWQRHG